MALVLVIPSPHLHHFYLHNILSTLTMKQTNDIVITHHITED